MTGAASAQESLPRPEEFPVEAVYPAEVEERVIAYLRKLGLRDGELVRRLSAACLQRASRRAAPGAHQELLRRALEEAQRRFDGALALSLNLQGVKNQHALAAARAALLLGDGRLESETFMLAPEERRDDAAGLLLECPQATPPEARLAMHEQPITFFFSRPSPARK